MGHIEGVNDASMGDSIVLQYLENACSYCWDGAIGIQEKDCSCRDMQELEPYMHIKLLCKHHGFLFPLNLEQQRKIMTNHKNK